MAGKPFRVSDVIRIFNSLDPEEQVRVRELLTSTRQEVERSITSVVASELITFLIDRIPIPGASLLINYLIDAFQDYLSLEDGDTLELTNDGTHFERVLNTALEKKEATVQTLRQKLERCRANKDRLSFAAQTLQLELNDLVLAVSEKQEGYIDLLTDRSENWGTVQRVRDGIALALEWYSPDFVINVNTEEE